VTVTYTSDQTGYDNGAAWFDPLIPWAMIVSTALGDTGGMTFNTPNVADNIMFRSLTLTLTPNAAPLGYGTFNIGLVDSLTVTAFSAANLASAQTTIPIYTETITAANPFQNGVARSFALNLGIVQPQTSPFMGNFRTAQQVLRHSGYNNELALVLTFTGTVQFPASDGTLVGDDVPALSGLNTSKPKLSRADYCPRCGRTMFRENLVTDGYTRQLVCPECWDYGEVRRPASRPPKEING